MITDYQAKFMRMLARVRNYYAHSVKNMSLKIPEVAERISPQDNGFSVENALYGISDELAKRKPSKLVMLFLRPFIFDNFAVLIRSVVAGINPPPFAPILLQAMRDNPDASSDPDEQSNDG